MLNVICVHTTNKQTTCDLKFQFFQSSLHFLCHINAMSSQLRLVTFDVTNTLLHIKHSIGVQYSLVAELYGIKMCENEKATRALSSSFKKVFGDMRREHPNFGLTSGMSSQRWWSLVVANTFRHSNCLIDSVSDAQLEQIS